MRLRRTDPIPVFVTEFQLKTTPAQDEILRKSFDAARMIYNGCLSQAKKRFKVVRQSRLYWKGVELRHALNLSGLDKESAEYKRRASEAKSYLTQAKNACELSGYSLMHYSTRFNGTWVGDHVDSQVVKTLTVRAFNAVERWIGTKFWQDAQPKEGEQVAKPVDDGTKKKRKPRKSKADSPKKPKRAKKDDSRQYREPKFKRYKDPVRSLSGCTNTQSIRLVQQPDGQYVMLWKTVLHKLELPVVFDPQDRHQAHAMSCPLRYTTLVRRLLRDKVRYFLQLTTEGLPLPNDKYRVGKGPIGIDLNVSKVAFVAPEAGVSGLMGFCPDLPDKDREIVRLSRQIERQRRANNPERYLPDGQINKHVRGRWKISKRQRQNESRLRELHRKLAEHRKSSHGQLVNQVLEHGDRIKAEKVNVQEWQQQWGKRIGCKAPGMFQQRLTEKAKQRGGQAEFFDTKRTALSQICPACLERVQKPLGQQTHKCTCGAHGNRHLVSAFLALHVDEKGLLDGPQAQKAWSEGGSTLVDASGSSNDNGGAVRPPTSTKAG